MDIDETQIKTKFDEYLQEMPEEVQDFMWGDLYDLIITAIQQTLSLNESQTALVKNAGYNLLIGVKSMGEVAKELKDAGMPEDTVVKALYLIDTEIITRAENITEFFTDTPEDSTSTIPPTSTTPSDILARMNQTLVKPTTIAPMKRTYVGDIAAVKPISEPVVTPSSPTIDPYRELPDAK